MRSKLPETLLISTVSTFTSILVLYVVISGRNPINRVGFALFVSVWPAILTFIMVKLCRLPEVWWCIVLVYLSLFMVGVLQQYLMRLAG